MNKPTIVLSDIIEPVISDELSYQEMFSGPYISPLNRVRQYSDNEFEEFIHEWAFGYFIRQKKYKTQFIKHLSLGGPGDKGRDIAIFFDEKYKKWDNYQCKHYSSPLAPSNIWLELGKLCYYTFIGDYTIPLKYYFVSPYDIGPGLQKYFQKPKSISFGLLDNWNEKCETKIIANKAIKLEDKFKQYVENFDFSIITYKPIADVIEEHSLSQYRLARFGGGFKKKRPKPHIPIVQPSENKMRYVQQLLEVYAEKLKKQVTSINDINSYAEYKDHFNRQREGFYSVESLREFSRDSLPPNDKSFENFKEEIYVGIVDTHNLEYKDGYTRLIETIKHAQTLQITGNVLINEVKQIDRCGFCHLLANDNELIWIKK